MTLQYLWIEDFRDIFYHIGFDFSDTHAFKYDYENKTLDIKNCLKSNLPKDFWGSNQNISVRGIIGENGTGKSSLLDFIKRNLCNVDNGHIKEFDDGNYFAVFDDFIIVKNCVVILHEEWKDKFVFVDHQNYLKRDELLKKTAFIYYSNVFDYKDDNGDLPKLINVSTNHLLASDSYLNEKEIALYEYVYKETKRQIDLISEFNYFPGFNLPKSILITISTDTKQYRRIINNKEVDECIVKYVSTPLTSKGMLRAKKLIYFNLLKLLNFREKISFNDVGSQLWELFTNNFDKRYLDEVISASINTKAALGRICLIMNTLDKLNSQQKLYVAGEESNTLFYNISDDNSIFYEFFNAYNSIVKSDSFMSFDWGHEFSSGEKARLSLFARLWQAKKEIDATENGDSIDSIVLMLDEPDLYFHSNWQRELFNTIINFLPQVFHITDNIQLFITVHSPFIVSDLPSLNIIPLKKNNGRVFQTELISTNSFGANIHTILADAFFMNEGLVGEFARIKIQEVFDWYHEKLARHPEYIKGIISMIGDPIIAVKLREMYAQKMGLNIEIERLEQQLIIIIARLMELRNIQGHDQNS